MSRSEEYTGKPSVDTADVSKQILAMFEKLPEEEKRRALQKLQPMMSSVRIHQPPTEVMGHFKARQAASTTSKCIASSEDRRIIVKPSYQSEAKLRLFSGTMPVPNNEVDFNVWYKAAAHLCKHDGLSADEKLAQIHDSLLSPALDIAQSTFDSDSLETTLKLLKNVYGSVEDPRDVLNDFHTTVMTPGEKPSEYLNRLYLKSQKLKNLDILQDGDVYSSLLKQFIYGCPDETLIMKLRLEEKENDPPSYGELLMTFRTFRTGEEKRGKKHFARTISRSNQHGSKPDVTDPELAQLKTEIASLQTQINHMSTEQNVTDCSEPKTRRTATRGKREILF
jgi:hypothetical protein